MSNHQTYCDVEANKDVSDYNRRLPTRLGVPGYINIIRKPSDSRLATPLIPLAPSSLIALTSPVIAQGSLLLSYSGPAGGACPDRRLLDEEIKKQTSSTEDQLTLPTIAQRTDASLKGHRSLFAQAFGHLTSLFGTTVSLDRLIIVIKTGDTLVQDDTVPFLTDQLPLWRGIWHKSSLLIPTSSDSITDYFVKVLRYLAIINEGLVMDRIRLLLYRVL
jgi:hypothetical protein